MSMIHRNAAAYGGANKTTLASVEMMTVTTHSASRTSEFLSLRTYLDDVNGFDVKFLRIRLLNNFVFVVGSCFYIAMDVLPYSGLKRGVDDDDYFPTHTQGWVDTYVMVYFFGAFLFIVTALLDLYLIQLGKHRVPHEIDEQLINREQARVRARQHNHPATMSGYVIRSSSNHNDQQQQEEEEEGCGCACACSYSLAVFVAWVLLLGGVCGVGSSIFVLHNLFISYILNIFSVHLYFIQACLMCYARCRSLFRRSSPLSSHEDTDDVATHTRASSGHPHDRDATTAAATTSTATDEENNKHHRLRTIAKWFLIVGDIAFGMGALLDVVVSYAYFFSTAYYPEAVATLSSGVLWLLAALLYGMVTVYEYHRLRRDIHNEATAVRLEEAAAEEEEEEPPPDIE